MSTLKVFVLTMYSDRMRSTAMDKLEDFLTEKYCRGLYIPVSFEEAVNFLSNKDLAEWLGLASKHGLS